MVIHVTDDLDLDRIAESGQCFRWQKTEENTYRIIAGSYCLYISSLGGGGFELDCSGEEFDCFWSDYFDLSENYREIRARIDPVSDPFLWQAAEHEKGIRILRQDPWEMLISFIISQNKNIPAIRRSIELLAETCGEKRTDRRGEAYYAFPDPKAVASLSEEELKGCRLGYRCKYVHAAAEAVAGGEIDLEELAGERKRLSGEDRLPGEDQLTGKSIRTDIRMKDIRRITGSASSICSRGTGIKSEPGCCLGRFRPGCAEDIREMPVLAPVEKKRVKCNRNT